MEIKGSQNINSQNGILISKIIKTMSYYDLSDRTIKYFESENFNMLINMFIKSQLEKEFKKNLNELVKGIITNTDLRFDYEKPMIWDNFGLSHIRLLGSGGKSDLKSGFGSDTEFDHDKISIKPRLEEEINMILSSLIQRKNLGATLNENGIWEKVAIDNSKYTLIKQILGEVWIDNMGEDDIKKLEIKTTSEKESKEKIGEISLGSLSFNLINYAVRLAKEKFSIELTFKPFITTPPNSRGREVEQQGVRHQ